MTEKKKDSDKASSGWKVIGWIVIAAGLLILAYGMSCFLGGWCPSPGWIPSLQEDKDFLAIASLRVSFIRVAFLVIGTGLVLLNLHFVNKRIQKTEEQIKGQQEQLKEQQRTNYLNGLARGIDMLYSLNNFAKQIGGVEQLRGLLEANKEDKERLKEIVRVLCNFVREIKNEEEEKLAEKIREEWKGTFLGAHTAHPLEIKQLKAKILGILGRKDLSLAKLETLNLKGARLVGMHLVGVDLSGADLTGAHLCGVLLQKANLEGVNLQRALLEQVYLASYPLHASGLPIPPDSPKAANLAGADLRGTCLSNTELWGVNLRGATFKGALLDQTSLMGANLLDVKVTEHEDFDLGQKTDMRYVLVREENKLFLPTQMIKTDAIWVREDKGEYSFMWRDTDLRKLLEDEPFVSKSELIEKLEEKAKGMYGGFLPWVERRGFQPEFRGSSEEKAEQTKECRIIRGVIRRLEEDFPD